MTGWQPIETVPCEGNQPVLVFCPKAHRGGDSCEVVVVYRNDEGGFDYWTNGGANAGEDFHFSEDEEPTHWMHLPPAPDPEKIAEQAREAALPPHLRKTAVTVIAPSGEVLGVAHVDPPEPFKPRTEGLLHPHVDELFGRD